MGNYNSGNDAASISPKLLPDDALLPRDNSGGIDYEPYTQKWGDGGRVTGAKVYLSASGGASDESEIAERAKGEKGTRKAPKGS